MKKILSVFSLSAAAVLLLGSCSEESIMKSGEGQLLLSTKIRSDVKVASRADLAPSEDELKEQLEVWISNEKGRLYRFEGFEAIPQKINLLSGHYVAEAWTGDSASASWDKSWYKGFTEFDINGGELTRVSLDCKIANTLVAVNYAPTVADVLTDYSMTVSHSRGSLTFTSEEDRTGYFMLPSGETILTYKLEGKVKGTGASFTREGTLEDVKHAYKYNLNVSCTESSEVFGGLYFKLEVDPTMEEIYEEYAIEIAPVIEGYAFDMAKPIVSEEGNVPRRSVIIKANSALTSVVLDCADFETLTSIGGPNVDLRQMVASFGEILRSEGISYDYMTAEDGTSMMKVSFEKELVNKFREGIHTVVISATDSKNKTTKAELVYNITNASAIAQPVNNNEVWTTKAVLRGQITKDGIETAYFQYRKVNDSQWTQVEAVADTRSRAGGFPKDSYVMCAIEDLEPSETGTTYEWQLVANDFTTAVQTFTTEAAAQLPNRSFEDWSGSTPLLICKNQFEMFWDSGNHGSATLKKNVTLNTTSPVHSGTYAISLESQKVALAGIGKFAAGNVFAGKYLNTDGTDGVLGWGRPFTSRPKQLKVWAHYTCATIDYNDGGTPPSDFTKGKPDIGTIYMALMDDHTENYTNASKGINENFAKIIKTKSSERALFDPLGADKPHVIAYGEHNFTETTAGSQLVEITIDLEYFQDIRPTYIILTASASKGGDYFAGGNSKLVLDDIELVY